jgi:hypothetical protein
MPFKPGDRVRYPTGKTGTVLSTPRQYDERLGIRLVDLVWRCGWIRCMALA